MYVSFLYSSRMQQHYNFGFAILEINYCIPDDSGEYTCRVSAKHNNVIKSTPVMERFAYAYNKRICYYDAVIEQMQSISMLL